MQNHETHVINKITFKSIFSLKIHFRAFRLSRRNEMETDGKNIYM